MKATRRAYLSALAGGTTVGLAGCLGGGGGNAAGDCDIGDPEPITQQANAALGPEDAPVTVQVFEDYACPHCATYSTDVFPRVRSNFVDSGEVRYQHHDLPIPVHERWSWKVPSAARAVLDATDDETFFEYAKLLFQNQGDFSMQLIDDLADEVGAPGCDARGAAINDTYRPVVEADRRRAMELAGDQPLGTPAVFVNGRLLQGWGYDAVRNGIRTAQG
jgi:protein-disulfide isomerase